MIKQNDAHTYWYNLFNKFEQSGQTIKRFCSKQDISLNQFMYWRKKVILIPNKLKCSQDSTLDKSKFREIKISNSKPENTIMESIKIIFPNQITIIMPVNLIEEKFTAILAKIKEVVC